MRCTNCGHQGTESATFCLNCGTRLSVPGGATVDHGTAATGEGLPRASNPTPVPGALSPVVDPNTKICTSCSASNPPSMKFCRQCGSTLPTKKGTPMGGRTLLSAPPVMMASPVASPALANPVPVAPPVIQNPPVIAPTPAVGTQICGLCQGTTPSGFAFCQLCGKPLAAASPVVQTPIQASTPVPVVPPAVVQAPVQVQPPTAVQTPPVQPSQVAPASIQTPPSVQASTPLGEPKATAIDGSVAGPHFTPTNLATGPTWGKLVTVTRSGADGKSHPLFGDYIEVGSGAQSQLRFEDPYLAAIHARIERVGQGTCKIVPIDHVNGVFCRVRSTTQVSSGDYILLGRELLRIDFLSPAEASPRQVVQHGVSRFGSPMREAWARLSLLLPNGAVRDVRYLHHEEVVLGREEGEISFREDEFLSRRHATLCWKKDVCTLSDLGSANGTFLRITEAMSLSDGDALRIGDQMFRYHPVG